MLNTLIGTLIVAVIRASMLYFEVDATQQQMVFGLVLIAASLAASLADDGASS